MNIFIISDTHFCHDNMYYFVDMKEQKIRPYQNAEEADVIMMQNWNKIVSYDDKVYHLGDVALNNRGLQIMNRLNGTKILIRPQSTNKAVFKDIDIKLKKYNPPSWIKLDKTKKEGEIIGRPTI